LHVVALDTERNRVVVGGREELTVTSLTAGNATWNRLPVDAEFRAACRIRYRHKPAQCRVVLLADDRFDVTFDTPQTSVTPGQAAVLYDGERVLGGGWIV
jgi:tRNA-specific 2-thiouridylase